MVGAGAPCDNCLLLRVGDESDGWVPVGCEDTVTPPPADAMAQVVNTRGRRIAIARAETYEGTSPLCVVCYEAVKEEHCRMDQQLLLETELCSSRIRDLELISTDSRQAIVRIGQDKEKLDKETLRIITENERKQKCVDDTKAEITALESELRCLEEGLLDHWDWIRDMSNSQVYCPPNLSVYETVENNKAELDTVEVWLDLFPIGVSKGIPTINGFRIAAGQGVPWPEVNSALGQCVLMVDVISHRFKSDIGTLTYKLEPRGERSRVLGAKKGPLDLWVNEGGPSPAFDSAMVCFVGCIRNLADFMKLNGGPVLHYRIQHENIGDCSCELSHKDNTPEKWSKAMKNLLSNLRIILKWFSTRDN